MLSFSVLLENPCANLNTSSLHFQKYKIERNFDFLDFDNNRSVNVEDLVLWADKAAEIMKEDGVSVSDEQKKQLLQCIRRVCKWLRRKL